ncbi:cysteine desulfurase family protein [Aquamicrobium segne]|uniref:Cysteine desulfurase n=1 Tax=Aquamicrobium segne TaxID=469547 RepID=A0ABW0H187_9HYPH
MAARAYLDYNASAPLLRVAREAVVAALEAANPSSVHGEGRAARRLMEEARARIAGLVNARPQHIVFTSGATEGATTLLAPDWRMGKAPLRFSHLYICSADHSCLRSGGRFLPDQITQIGVDGQGLLKLDALAQALASHDKAQGLALVAVHAANNESGVVQPLEDIASVVKAAGGVLVLDAVQAAGRILLDMSKPCADYLILSAHKIGGPKGVGAIIAASDLMMPQPLITGGGQEKSHRAGTENLPGIAGFGAAAESASESFKTIDEVRKLRDRFEDVVLELVPDALIFGRAAPRLANTLFFAIPGLKAETAQIAFDLAGVALSAGSACSSGKVGASPVLTAMGFDEIQGALRVSIGQATDMHDLELFRSALAGIVSRRSGGGRAA